MKFLKHKKTNKKFSKKPGRPKKLPTRASNHQKRISKVLQIFIKFKFD